jgi:hypothetical protein
MKGQCALSLSKGLRQAQATCGGLDSPENRLTDHRSAACHPVAPRGSL